MFRGLQRRQFSAWAVASALSGPMVSEASITPQKVNIALAAKSSLFHLPLVLADQLGIFKQEGLHIDWVECESGSSSSLTCKHVASITERLSCRGGLLKSAWACQCDALKP